MFSFHSYDQTAQTFVMVSSSLEIGRMVRWGILLFRRGAPFWRHHGSTAFAKHVATGKALCQCSPLLPTEFVVLFFWGWEGFACFISFLWM